MKVKTASYVKSGTSAKHWPDLDFPEIAFGGRSNVGKSSLINSLLNRKKLVKTSGRPGHTQTINFFNVNDSLCLVDLPGYGYAKAPEAVRAQWGRMVEGYLQSRDELMAVICIMDLRRGIQDDDMMLIQAAPLFGFQPILVFTKADKLKSNARRNKQRELAKELGVKPADILLYSAHDHTGREELWDRICQLTGLEND